MLFKSLEIANFAEDELSEYIKDMITERDLANQMKTAENKGHAEGLADAVERLIANGFTEEDAKRLLGLDKA